MTENLNSDRKAPVPPGEASPPAPAPAAAPKKENIKETIESILVAFILAFVFRAFVVEAFVIPSGSMAPTLMGAHMRFRCQECGYEFTVNYPTSSRDDTISIPSRVQPAEQTIRKGGMSYRAVAPVEVSAHCPNCGFKVPRGLPDEYQSATSSLVYYGDRILVLKYLYLLQQPTRWDVVVFKAPILDAATHDYTTNYIKRLVGKPGEAIMLLNGDVYISTRFQEGQSVLETPAGQLDQWQVQRKPRAVQETLWRVVFDNDYLPLNSTLRQVKWKEPWEVESGAGWDLGKGASARIFHFSSTSAEPGVLKFDRQANPDTFPFTDWLPYNETMRYSERPGDMRYEPNAYGEEQVPRWNVSDIKMRFDYQRNSGEGPLVARITKLDDGFEAIFTPGQVKLVHHRPGQAPLVVGESALPSAEVLQVELTNVDYQVTVRVNGKDLVQTTSSDPKAASYYGPDVKDLLERHRRREELANSGSLSGTIQQRAEQVRDKFPPPSVHLSAANQTATISHLSLWRDIYYTPNLSAPLKRASPENPAVMHRRGTDGKGHSYENEYFVLGDNSILSSDARVWEYPVDLRENEDLAVEAGRVPERFLLGKAFFVYWPAGYRPFSPNAPGVIPNFGDMRIIH